MKYIPLILLLPMLCSCSKHSSNRVDAEYQRQLDDFDRQTEVTDRQQDETERQLKRSKEQADQLDALLDKWEQQAERQDRIIDGLDRIILSLPEGPKAEPDAPE